MRIGIDLRYACASHTGTGVYTETAARQLAAVRGADDCVFAFLNSAEAALSLPDSIIPVMLDATEVDGASDTRDRLYLDAAIAARKPDVFWAPTGIAPLVKSCPVVVTIHDLLFERRPEFYSPRLLRYLQTEIPRSIREADCVLAISETTRREIVELYGIPDTRIRVIPQGVRDIFASKPKAVKIPGKLAAMGITSPYVLMLSNHAKHKNAEFAFAVFSQWAASNPGMKHLLVVAGGGMSPSQPAELWRLAEQYGVRERCRLLGPVSDDALPLLYAGAAAFLFPSEYEGWGLPPVEAMLMGAPVLVSDRGALPEAIGNAGKILPLDREIWIATLGELLQSGISPSMRKAMATRRKDILNSNGKRYLELLREAAQSSPLRSKEYTMEVMPARLPGISGCTIVRNAVELGYPLRESVASYAPICQEVVLAWDPSSTDSTRELVRQIAAEFPQVRLVESVWDLENRDGGSEIAKQTEIAFRECRREWTLYIQADEALHEDAHAELIRLIADAACGGIAFARRSFLRTLDAEITEHRVGGLIRLFRTGFGKSLGDAMQCGVAAKAGKIVGSDAMLFNYSRLGNEAEILRRCRNLHSFYHAPGAAKTNKDSELNLATAMFHGTHPAPIERSYRRPANPDRENRPADRSRNIYTIEKPRICVHVITNERDELGRMFSRSCLESLRGYPDRLVIVDNGCGYEIAELVQQVKLECPVRVLSLPEETRFDKLRNAAVALTEPDITHIHVIDTDEVYFPESLAAVREFLAATTCPRITSTFHHFMIEPTQFVSVQKKPVIFKFTPQLRWKGEVHETVGGGDSQATVDGPGTFLHFGYCRPQWQTLLKWLNYAMLQDGSLAAYKSEYIDGVKLPWFWNKKSPDEILDSRRPHLQKYAGIYPASTAFWLEDYRRSGENWRAWVDRKTASSLWEKWRQKFRELGNWEDTLEYAVALAKNKQDLE